MTSEKKLAEALQGALVVQSPKVVPFGKYRGQPVEVLRQDQSYLDWLAGQEGIRRQYPWIFVAAEATETPEHNRYQALFLDTEFVNDLCDAVCGPDWRGGEVLSAEFEKSVKISEGNGRYKLSGPADVHIGLYEHSYLRVEIKPAMGDDYPIVLRKMHVNHCNVLYLVSYTGTGATLSQVRKMFAASRIVVLLHSDFWEIEA